MSINSVSRSLQPYYGPTAAANNSPAAKSAAPANETADTTGIRATAIAATGTNSDPGEQVESALERALRQTRIATGTSQDGGSSPAGGRSAPAIGLYRRVSQYSDNKSSVSGLMKTWNDIVRENQFEDAGVAGHAKAIAQNDAVALPSRVLHLTV